VKPAKKEKVAIIGAGPAGLAAAYDLSKEGYSVTVFEALPVAGGLLTVGVPEYRLPREIVVNEINDIKKLGVNIKLNTRIKDATELLKHGYQAVFIGTGAHKGAKMGIPGEDLNGVYDAIEFLKEVNLGNEISVQKKVIVIGGGNSAIDSARVALRKGAEEVHILYRREKKDMPAIPDEIAGAEEEEGISFDFLTVPTKILSENGRVTGVECIRMELKEFDKSGRKVPYPIEGSKYTIPADMVIVAIGQRADPPIGEHNAVECKRGWIVADPRTFCTTVDGVFAGGEAVTGSGTVIGAIAAGQKAAFSIKRYLEGKELIPRIEREDEEVFELPIVEEEKEIEPKSRVLIKHLHSKDRITSFEEIIVCYSPEEANMETKRCLRCDVKEALL
ncbi:MAG: FAD-dependent oxidoreductase, partial [Candidatus Hodarchaeota archaeon]